MSDAAIIDVRPLLRAGREPFAAIRARIDALEPGDHFTVVSPFLPSPLIELSRSLGHEVTPSHRSDGAWATRISRPR